MTKKAVYAGSFDPLTNGHLWMIQKGAELFDELIVAIGVNPDKKSTFSLEERMEMLRRTTKSHPNVNINSYAGKYLVKYAEEMGASYILRGIRNPQDYEYERVMCNINHDLNPNIQTTFHQPPREIAEVSSSFVKGLIGPEGWEEVVEKYVPSAVYQKFLEKFNGYFERWKALWSKTVPESNPQESYSQILSCYSGKQRFYHNLVHIAHSLREFDSAKKLAEEPLALEMAIFLHDLIYDTHSTNNEEDSAEAAEELLGLPQRCPEFREKVKSLIMATAPGVVKQSKDEQLMSDIDLASWGYASEIFDRNTQDIREEYSWVPEEVFCQKRAEVLQGFLNRENIYYTEHFRQRYETQARGNLQRFIAELTSHK